jgi:hypothetical protein
LRKEIKLLKDIGIENTTKTLIFGIQKQEI